VALRGLLGEETFNEAFHRFIDVWAYKHPYPSDLFNTFEAVSGRNLDWFWHSWYYEAWTLDHAVANVATQGDGSATVTIRDRGKAFMPARVTVARADGSTTQHTVPVSVWLEGTTETTLDLPPGPAIERVEIDAERAFPDIDRSNNVWTPSDAPPASAN
jgi:aminopeptidase N